MGDEVRRIQKAAGQQGWRVERTTKGQWRFVPPDPTRRICIFSGTLSDRRALRSFVAELRRQGFVWPWPPEGAK